MPRPALRLLLVVLLFALSGCAPRVPWPPAAGSCIEYRSGLGKGARLRYRIGGKLATREDVERAVSVSPQGRAAIARGRRLGAIAYSAIGLTSVPPTLVVAGVLHSAFPLFFALPALGLGITAITILADADEPLRWAVLDFNARVAREGTCPWAKAEPAAPSPPRRPVTDEEVLHPRWGPPPLGH